MKLLLLSGGLDSAALAAWTRPDVCLTIDYGQRNADGEITAAREVARSLGLSWEQLSADCSAIGSGLLAGSESSAAAPNEEWWPFRNQLLITLGAAWGLKRGATEIQFGAVAGDDSYVDGRPEFLAAVDNLVSMQEGGVHITAPAIAMSSAELLSVSKIAPGTLAWTHSCNASSVACGWCRSCVRRESVLAELRLLQQGRA